MAPMGALHGVLVTYRRMRAVAEAARRAADESRPPEPAVDEREPVFLKRYLPADRE